MTDWIHRLRSETTVFGIVHKGRMYYYREHNGEFQKLVTEVGYLVTHNPLVVDKEDVRVRLIDARKVHEYPSDKWDEVLELPR